LNFKILTKHYYIFEDSSDTDEGNPVSTTTSWEYLSKASSWSDLRCQRSISPSSSPTLTSPRHQNHRTSRYTKLDGSNCNRFIKFKSSNPNPASFHRETHSIPVTRSASFHSETLIPNHSLLSSYKNNDHSIKTIVEGPMIKSQNRSPEIQSACYNVPLQPDIYSLPIDNIHATGDQNKTAFRPQRSRCRGPSRNIRKTVGQDVTNLSDQDLAHEEKSSSSKNGEQSLTDRLVTHKKSVKLAVSLDSSCGNLNSNSQAFTKCDMNSYEFSRQTEIETSRNRNFRPPRSRSVEMSNSGDSVSSSQKNSSQNSNLSTLLTDQHRVRKVEKRTLGHSILNLFKRNKPRPKGEPLQSTSSNSEENQ